MPITAQFVRNLQRFRLVTFDVTDTLIRLKNPVDQYIQMAEKFDIIVQDRSKMERCFRQQFKMMSSKHANFGHSTPDMSWQSWWLQLVCQTFSCVDSSLTQSQLQTLAEKLLTVFRTSACWTHVPCAADLVQRMHQADKCVGIISNFDPSLPQVLEAMGFDNKFNFVLTSYEAGVMKPDPGIFDIACQRFNIEPAQALHIGNKYDMDYLGACQSGWCSLLVLPDQEANTAQIVKNGHAFASLAQMLQTLETEEIIW